MVHCNLCGNPLDPDSPTTTIPLPLMAVQPGVVSYCGKCAPLVRPGMYAVPGNVCHKALELLASFKELPPYVRDRLVLCFGPQTWNDIRKEEEANTLLEQIPEQSPIAEMAMQSVIPIGAAGRFLGYWCHVTYGFGPGALFVRLGPPA